MCNPIKIDTHFSSKFTIGVGVGLSKSKYPGLTMCPGCGTKVRNGLYCFSCE